MDCPAPPPGLIFPMPDALATQEMPPLPVAYSPSNALSTPELLLIDPTVSDWFDALRAGEHAVTFGAPSRNATVSPSLPPPLRLAGLEGIPLNVWKGFRTLVGWLLPLEERWSAPGR